MISLLRILIPALLLVGCSQRQLSESDLSAMSDAALQDHWAQLGRPASSDEWAYRYRVQKQGVQRFGAGWPEMERLWVLERKIWEGMTGEQLYWSWGKPQRRFTDEYPPFTYEHWYWDVSRWSTGREATLQDGQVVWYRIGSVER